jgi:hypothetical protein
MYELAYDELGERQRKLLVEKKIIAPKPEILQNIKLMQDYGIIIAAGTDAGNVGVIHGPAIFHEFELMAEAGLTPQQILTDATLNAAKLLGKDNMLGSVEKGKYADLVILNSNPLENIMNTSDIDLVMKNGKVFSPDFINKKPEDLAQIQLNAYNAKDVETFVRAYSPDVEVYKFPDSLLYTGREKMYKIYKEFFEKAPELHCRLVGRSTLGNFVIDREVVTGIPEKGELNAVAIYEISGGLIRKVWFMQ